MSPINPVGIEPPEYQLFELMLLVFQTDEGRWLADLVQVVGVEWNSVDFYKPGWSYLIQYVGQPSQAHLQPGHREVTEPDCLWPLRRPIEMAGKCHATLKACA